MKNGNLTVYNSPNFVDDKIVALYISEGNHLFFQNCNIVDVYFQLYSGFAIFNETLTIGGITYIVNQGTIQINKLIIHYVDEIMLDCGNYKISEIYFEEYNDLMMLQSNEVSFEIDLCNFENKKIELEDFKNFKCDKMIINENTELFIYSSDFYVTEFISNGSKLKITDNSLNVKNLIINNDSLTIELSSEEKMTSEVCNFVSKEIILQTGNVQCTKTYVGKGTKISINGEKSTFSLGEVISEGGEFSILSENITITTFTIKEETILETEISISEGLTMTIPTCNFTGENVKLKNGNMICEEMITDSSTEITN